jgi:hypothetical protein
MVMGAGSARRSWVEASRPVRARTLTGIDVATQTPAIPQEVRDTLTGLAFAAGDGTPDPAMIEKVLYPHCKCLGTTRQVTEEMWPADRAAFEEYWNAWVARIEMDDLTRGYLQGVADLSFVAAPLGIFGAPLRPLLRPIGRFLTLGFLPQPFRDELGLPWNDQRQRRFDALIRAAVAVTRMLPRPLREFPLNGYLWDTRRRIRKSRRMSEGALG